MVLVVPAARDRWKALLVLSAIVGSACQAGVVPGTAYEQPLELLGRLSGPLPAGANPIFSVVWTDPLQRRPDLMMPPGWASATVAEVAAPAAGAAATDVTFTIKLFRPPPDAALVEIPSPSGQVATLALGELVIVNDADGDGTFRIDGEGTIAGQGEAGDRYVAGTQTVLVYVQRPFSGSTATTFPLGQLDRAGYALIAFECSHLALVRAKLTTGVTFEPQTSRALLQRRTCMQTHSP